MGAASNLSEFLSGDRQDFKAHRGRLGAGSKDLYLWDEDLAGFGVKVTPAGRKIFLVQYRLGGRAGKVRRVTIGQHGSPWTVDGARKEAQGVLGDVAKGVDVAERVKTEQQAATGAPTAALASCWW